MACENNSASVIVLTALTSPKGVVISPSITGSVSTNDGSSMNNTLEAAEVDC